MRLFGRRYSQMDVSAGSDGVLIGYPIPSGGVLNNVHLNVHVIGPEGVPFQSAVMYGVSAFVVMLPDPDTEVTYDTVWDNLIPKDVAASSGVFDLDPDTLDGTAEFEMGELDFSGIFDMTTLAPREIFQRRKMLTIAGGQASYLSIDSAADSWTPADRFATKISRSVRVAAPSAFMLGFSSPGMNVTTATVSKTPKETEWAWLQYLEMGLEQAFIHLLGLVEAGAETPWVEAGTFIASLLEEAAFENVAASFHPATFRVFTTATIDLSVPGTMSQKVLSSEG